MGKRRERERIEILEVVYKDHIPMAKESNGRLHAFLVEHCSCKFPWPSGRDLKNPTASPAGTDLVGFQKTGVSSNSCTYRFAFGEVKTSGQEAWPPSVMDGRHGLRKQVESLRDSNNMKDSLVKYLGHHAKGTDWFPHFKNAASRYIADPHDVSLFGIMIRDVTPKPEDLRERATALATGCPRSTSIELRAMYLPPQSIGTLSRRAIKAREGKHGQN